MVWYIEAEFTGVPAEDALEDLALATAAIVVHTDAATRRTTIRWSTDDPGLPTIQDRIIVAVSDHGLTGPRRILVENEEAHAEARGLLGARDVAARLGISQSRMRKLRERPDWPKPVFALPSGEEIHTVAAIDAFAAGWDRSPGRPSKAA